MTALLVLFCVWYAIKDIYAFIRMIVAFVNRDGDIFIEYLCRFIWRTTLVVATILVLVL